ncbi:GH92 family glycosyl hydrolase [Halorussus salilacus]|uniref:GH92 family glycosyl hydrolase n=1 Tax=Halorussus salilacus TaxID=2953750 RepID=UPI0020A122FA|nr:GH92 family glycosyl hydrolase [Halorussus salilacus]USZ67402.1 GH92 family glycosyl hydrolase [Halorussus salilacus]
MTNRQSCIPQTNLTRRAVLGLGTSVIAGLAGCSGSKTDEEEIDYDNLPNRSELAPDDNTHQPNIDGKKPAEWVEQRIDTSDTRWFYFSSACRPFGLVNLSPDTVTDGTWDAGYVYDREYVRCFSHVHAWQLAGIPVMPTTGEFKGHQGMDSYESRFNHDDEVVKPGYHRVELEAYDVTAELTSTTRVGVHRYTFPEDDESRVLFDTGADIGQSDVSYTEVQRVNDREIAGYSLLDSTLRRPKETPVFFVAQFSEPFNDFEGWKDGKQLDGDFDSIAGSDAGAAVRYDTSEGDSIIVKVGISYTSVEGARRNLEGEFSNSGFDEIQADAVAEWNQWLGRVEVSGGSDKQKTKFYTDLWHALQGRRIVSDIDGRYSDFTGSQRTVRRVELDSEGRPRYPHHQHDAWWGSQWNLNILWSIAYPRVMSSFCNSMVRMYKDGGLLPRGPSGGNYTYVMIGDQAVPFIAAAWHKGIRDFDIEAAYEGLRKNAFPGGIRDHAGYEHTDDARGGGMEYYIDQGYVPADIEAGGHHREGASMTLEYAYQDWCLAELADSLDHREDATQFRERAQNYRHLWDDDWKYMRPRNKDGSWLTPFHPFGEGNKTEDFTEANSAIYTNFVPHDVAGLAELFGSPEKYAERLDKAFREGKEYDFVPENKERASHPIDFGNQPGLHMAHLFNYIGQPWKTQRWVRQVKEEAYGNVSPYAGYHGDEDQGQIGALGVLMALGLFSVRGGAASNPIYDLTSCIFDEVTIRLDDDYYSGDTFTIRTTDNEPANQYIQSASLNGEVLDGPWFPHEELAAGGEIELELGPEPNKNWGGNIKDAPPSEQSNSD